MAIYEEREGRIWAYHKSLLWLKEIQMTLNHIYKVIFVDLNC